MTTKQNFTMAQQAYRYLWFIIRFLMRLIDVPITLVLMALWFVFELFGKVADMFMFLSGKWDFFMFDTEKVIFKFLKRKFNEVK